MKKTSKRFPAVAAAMLLAPCLSYMTWAQSSAPDAAVPRAVNYSGMAKDVDGKPLAGVVGATFAVYAEQTGGAPLWMETQNVSPSANGKYTVVLGSTLPNGIPLEVFSSGQARWVGVSYNGAAEQARVALLSVPYALKAGDAQTIGGLPPSAFVLATSLTSATPAITSHTDSAAPDTVTPDAPSNVTTTGGTINTLPLWTTATNVQSSAITQAGSGATARIGIGIATPATTLDVKGGATVRGTLTLPAAGTATAAAGTNSQAEKLVASSFSSSTSTAVPQTFQWQAEPAGNDTTSPSGTMNLLFGSGTATPAETGLKISNKGLFTFASGQSFPGTGTITGVTTAPGSGLIGGGANGSLTLSLVNTCGTSQVLQWNGTQWGCGNAGGGGITGVTAGTDLTGGGTSGNVTLNLNTSATDARYAQLTAANTFTGNQTVTGSVTSTGIVQGMQGYFANATGAISLEAVQNDTTRTDVAVGGIIYSAQQGSAGVEGLSLATSGQVFGVEGIVQSPNAFGVYGVDGARSSTGTHSTATGGVWGDAGSIGGIGVFATADDGDGLYASNNAPRAVAVAASNASTTGAATAVYGVTYSATGTGIVGQSDKSSVIFDNNTGLLAAGINGDTGLTGGVGVWGTADSGYAVYGVNNGSYVTGLFLNQSTASSYALEAGSLTHNCTVDTAGDLKCSGTTSGIAELPDQRRVQLYAVQSPENWFEDFGSGQLANGKAVIELEPTFAQTVNTGAGYHVFLTPNGDSRGLYVTAKSATSFEVHEQGGGTSNVAFDYRIVAKRAGYENVRLADVTESQNQLMADTKRVAMQHDDSQVRRQPARGVPGVAHK